MKQQILLCLVLCLSVSLFAKKVDEPTARKVAVNWFNETAGEMKYPLSAISEVFYETKGDDVLLYIFNISKDGFIIIPADDNVRPVLGWSMENPYQLENHPPQFDYFLRMYKEAVKLGDDYKEEGVDPIQEWARLSVNPVNFTPQQKERSVGPLLTSNWHQGWSWNQYCPVEPDAPWWCNSHCPVGCVATAMAEIMYYWKYTNSGEGSNGYNSGYGYLSANFGNANYIWSEMEDYNGSTASALLCYHCGISVNMDYGYNGSGAYSEDVDNAFQDHFRYHNDVIFKNRYSNYTDWVNLLIGDLELGRPIYYSGIEPGAPWGHAWVVDGYSSGDVFHVNYGHGGGSNGWYSIANVPTYTDGHDAVVYIYPEIPTDLVLASANTTGTYTAYNSITMNPGFTTGTATFVGQIFEPNKGANLKVLFNGITISEFEISKDYTSVYPDLWNGCDSSGKKVEPGEYQYIIYNNDMEIKHGYFSFK